MHYAKFEGILNNFCDFCVSKIEVHRAYALLAVKGRKGKNLRVNQQKEAGRNIIKPLLLTQSGFSAGDEHGGKKR